jgi:hypothetical protein
MWYKVVKNNTVVDLLKDPSYVKLQEQYNLKLLCDKSEATQVLSSDGEVCYDLSEYVLLGISEYEYLSLKEKMFSQQDISSVAAVKKYHTQNMEEIYNYSTSERAEVSQLRKTVLEMENTNKELKQINSEMQTSIEELIAKNQELTNCLLEMSELVYE